MQAGVWVRSPAGTGHRQAGERGFRCFPGWLNDLTVIYRKDGGVTPDHRIFSKKEGWGGEKRKK